MGSYAKSSPLQQTNRELSNKMIDTGTTELSKYDGDINKAQSLAHWSFVGLFVPIIGWILAGLSIHTLSLLPEEVQMSKKAHGIKSMAKNSIYIGIILSAILFYLGVKQYQGVQLQVQQAQRAREEQSKAQREKEDTAKFNREFQQRQFSNCLDAADTDYWSYIKLNGVAQADGSYRALQYVWDNGSKQRSEAKNECYRRYPIN